MATVDLNIPVIIESGNNNNNNNSNGCSNAGFPFQNSNTRDPLEDIAVRHPEFAEHLQGFPRRSNRSNQSDDDFLRHFDRPFLSGRRFDRFPFNRDNFDGDAQNYFEAYPEYFPQSPNSQRQQSQHQQPQQQQQQPSQSYPYSEYYQQTPPQNNNAQYSSSHSPSSTEPYQQNQPTLVSQGTQTETTELPPQSSGTDLNQEAGSTAADTQQGDISEAVKDNKSGGPVRGRPIQQSNTVDLGQAQPLEDLVDVKNQRSMSAPPENKRFTSSINIPVGLQQREENGNASSHSQSASSGSTGRIIPIHVEGRDAPVIPKHVDASAADASSSPRASQPQPERIFTDYQRPQTDRGFTQRGSAADPFRLPNDWHRSRFDQFPEDDFRFFRGDSPSRFSHPKQFYESHSQPSPHMKDNATQNVHETNAGSQHPRSNSPQVQKQQHQSTQQAAPPQPSQQQQQQQQQKPHDPIKESVDKIQIIQTDVASLLRQVEQFKGIPKDKNYLYIDEMLTRNLLKLDDVETHGQDSIRSARKEAIKSIERAISLLESKAAANATAVVPCVEKMEAEAETEAEPTTKMDVTTENVSAEQPKPTEIQPSGSSMDITAPSDDSAQTERNEKENQNQEPATADSSDNKNATENVPTKEESEPQPKEGTEEKGKPESQTAVTTETKEGECSANVESNQQAGAAVTGEDVEASPEGKDSGKKEKKKGKKKVTKDEKSKKE